MSSSPRRTFPHLSWAWPHGARHLLICAAICPNETQALEAMFQWLKDNKLDDAGFPEHRLLAAITSRFDAQLRKRPEYPKLQGLQRLNWTRSRLAVATATPTLTRMSLEGIQFLLLKGASRIALDPAEQKSRTSYDLDVLVRREDFARAFEILVADDWKSVRGESVLGLRARLSSVRARNFKKGRFGDIDLHQMPYQYGQQDMELDNTIFTEAIPVDYYGISAAVPSAEERLCLAIANGGRESHAHSDWLVDMARILATEEINWPKVIEILRRRRIRGPAAVALSYLAEGIGLPIPAFVIPAIITYPSLAGLLHPITMLATSEAKGPTSAAKIASNISKEFYRLCHSGRNRSKDSPSFQTMAFPVQVPNATEFRSSQPIAPQCRPSTGRWAFDLQLVVPAQSRRRRLEFELNGAHRNIGHFRAINIWKNASGLRLRFRGRVNLIESDFPLTLTALAGKLLEETTSANELAKYAPVPFRLNRAELT